MGDHRFIATLYYLNRISLYDIQSRSSVRGAVVTGNWIQSGLLYIVVDS